MTPAARIQAAIELTSATLIAARIPPTLTLPRKGTFAEGGAEMSFGTGLCGRAHRWDRLLSAGDLLDSFLSAERIAGGVRASCGQNQGTPQVAGERHQGELGGVADEPVVADLAIAVAALPQREHGLDLARTGEIRRLRSFCRAQSAWCLLPRRMMRFLIPAAFSRALRAWLS